MPKQKRKSRRSGSIFPVWSSLILLILIGVASFSFYFLINRGIGDLLNMVGVTNFYAQNITALVIVLLILIIFGFGFRKSIERIARR